jgi:putative peptidoglycan lipid II flippase
VALSTILIPSLTRAHSAGAAQEYSSLIDWGLRLVLLLALPCSVALLFLAQPLAAMLFHSGKFSGQDVLMVSHALIAYGVGLVGLIAVKVLAPGYYAQQNIKTPVKIGIAVLIVTQILNLIFVPIYAHAGLALAIGLGACINAVFLLAGLLRRKAYVPAAAWGKFLCQLAGPLLIMAAVAWWGSSQFNWVKLGATPFLRALWCILLMIACGLAYGAALWCVGLRPHQFKKRSPL